MRSTRKREPIDVAIENLSHEGRGVGRVNGKTVFVAGALPGEQVHAKKLRGRRSFDEAIALSVANPNPDRVVPKCLDYDVCGGCSLQHFDPQKQLEHKQAVLLELLSHHADTSPEIIQPPITGPLWHYRRRARLGVKYVPKKGGTLVGFREKTSPYIADIRRCEVLDKRVGYELMALRTLVDTLSIRERIPQFEVAIGDDQAALIVRHLQPFSDEDLARLAVFQDESEISIYLQPGGEDSVHPLNQGSRNLNYHIEDIEFAFAPNNFVQINADINRQMIHAVKVLMELGEGDRVLDFFCGLGNFTLPIARCVTSVTGLEGSEALVNLARSNALANDIHNANFATVDLADEYALKELDLSAFNKLLLDPPRSGAGEIFSMPDFSAIERIAYVSCNPVTFARDARQLIEQHKFTLKSLGVMDMFPHTAHVESMALFVRA